MPRNYVPKPGAKRYKKYDELIMKQALDELASTSNSLTIVANKYNISKSVLCRHKNREMKPHGRPIALSKDVEEYIVENLNICGDWGCPLDTMDLRYIIKMYLDQLKIQHKVFKNNLPGIDYVSSFLKRHKTKVSQRICQNIKRSRAAVCPETIKKYFCELSKSLENVPVENIINYDETNLSDDPGRKKVIVRRGCKYPERIVNHSKGSISLMMAATAAGELLPPYVVYKAAHLYDSWTKRGPVNARYNRSQSGWFDGEIFADWIKTTVIPFLEKKEGKKILIGDNLSSHLSIEIIQLCKEKDIDFVFLPANSTHLTQPLDVAFFRPMKMVWRQLLDKWKRSEDGRTQSCVPKGCFPRLLKLLIDQLEVNADKNIRAGFRKCGIVPLNANEVLDRLPLQEEDKDTKKTAVNDSFLQFLKEMRYRTMHIKEPKKKRKLEVVAGKSVSGEEVEKNEAQEPVKSKKKRTVRQENDSATNNKPWKGKGIGKKTKSQTQLPKIDKKNINDSQNNNAEIAISKQTKDMKNDDNIINTDSMQDHRSPQKLITGRTQENSNSKKTKQIIDDSKGKQNILIINQSETALKETLNQNTNRKTNDENAIEKTINLNDANMIPELMHLDIESMPFILADNIDYYQEIVVETDKLGQKDQRFQNRFEDQNKNKNKKLINIDYQENVVKDYNESLKEQTVQNGCEEDQNEKENKKLEENVVMTENEIQNGCEVDQNKKENKKLGNVYYQENVVQSNKENHKQQKVQNGCEEDQNEKENIKKYSEGREKPIIKIISDIKLPLPLPVKKSKSKDRQKPKIKIMSDIKPPLPLHTRSKSTCPKKNRRERRLSFYKDQEKIIKILEAE